MSRRAPVPLMGAALVGAAFLALPLAGLLVPLL